MDCRDDEVASPDQSGQLGGGLFIEHFPEEEHRAGFRWELAHRTGHLGFEARIRGVNLLAVAFSMEALQLLFDGAFDCQAIASVTGQAFLDCCIRCRCLPRAGVSGNQNQAALAETLIE